MSDQDYYSNPAVSASLLKLVHQHGTLKAKAIRDADKDSKALAFGRAYHMLILEEAKFDVNYFVMPKLDLRTKAGKAMKQEMVDSHPGMEAITQDDYEILAGMKEAIMDNSLVRGLLRNIEVEEEYYYQISGIDCKSKIDAMTVEHQILELKTTRDIKHFPREFWKYSYHIQAAMYLHAAGVPVINFIAQDNAYPYEVRVFRPSEDVIDAGNKDMMQALIAWNIAERSGDFRHYPEEIEELGL